MAATFSERAAIEAVWRIDAARIVATLTQFTGDLGLAEDVAQDALAEALASWPRDGIPRHPAAWLLTVGRRRAIDAFRRRTALDERQAALARELPEGGATSGAIPPASGDDLPWDPDRIDDDLLGLMFVVCHPVLSREGQIALTLRVLGGLSSAEIARAFLVPVPTVQARITRAKKALAAARVPLAVPAPEDRRQRLDGVLGTLYLIFTEGAAATSGPDWIRPDLAREAVRLTRVLARLMPQEAEVHGLLALLELTAARFPARVDPAGRPVLLADQDRRRWDRSAIRRGRALLARARTGRGLGFYGVQAAIAECHAVAPSVQATDWALVVRWYGVLARLAPSPVVSLNRAVAVAMAAGPAAGLPIVDQLVADGALAGSHLVPSVRGELLARLGRPAEARAEFEHALAICRNEAERGIVAGKLAALGDRT